MKRLMMLVMGLMLVSVVGCSDAENARSEAWGYENLIVRYSGGKRVEEYVSTGKVETVTNSDGWYFREKHTGKAILISGGVTIRVFDPEKEVFETEQGKLWYTRSAKR
jgi:hypothetical protein